MFRQLITLILWLWLIPGMFAQVVDNKVLGGQIYSRPHRSTLEEFEQRKKYYHELVNLANANRQCDFITFNIKEYRKVADRVWNSASQRYNGQVRAIPVCEELIPAEYQEPESKKKTYYKQAALWHSNLCCVLRELPEKERNICIYCSLSTEIEMLEKPLRDLTPETIYTMKNLDGRIKYLRKLYPERNRVGVLIASMNTDYVSPVNRAERQGFKAELKAWGIDKEDDLLHVADYPPEQMKIYTSIAQRHFETMAEIYEDDIDIQPVTEKYMLPLQCFKSESYKREFIKHHASLHQNFYKYLDKLSERERLICIYIQKKQQLYLMLRPILDLASDNPYPMENLYLRMGMRFVILAEIERTKAALNKIENNQERDKRS